MGFFDKIGAGIKETATKISDNIKANQATAELKKRILSRFEINDVKGILHAYGYETPLSVKEWDIIEQKNITKKLGRPDYINTIMNKLSLEQIQSYAEKHRIRINDLTKDSSITQASSTVEINPAKEETKQEAKEEPKEITQIIVSKTNEFDELLRVIGDEFEPEEIRSEEDLEKQLFQYLKVKFPNKVERQVPSSKGRIDILYDGKFALELKIMSNKNVIRNLVAQALDYQKVYPNIAVILLDSGQMVSSEYKEYIEDFHKHKIKVVIVNGVLKHTKKKGRDIRINVR